MSKSLVVNEIFFSIQGESSYAGRPCSFVRLAHCDLRCSWCDTTYSFYEGQRMNLDQIWEKVRRHPTRLVEVTGGEPLLQEPVHLLVQLLLDAGKQVLIETGGHRDISRVDPRAILIYDIKCPASGMVEKNRWENIEKLRPHDEIKFVIASQNDYEWAKARVAELSLAGRNIVHFSPVWGAINPRTLAEWILADGLPVRMQLQLHKLLWGTDARGV